MKKLLKSNTFKVFRNCTLYTLFVGLLLCTLINIGEVKAIVTYSNSGVSYLQSSHLIDKYVPKPVIIEEPEKPEYPVISKYRLTSFYPKDELNTGHCTGSGYCSWDFDLDEHGWYRYKGKLVIAAATTYLQKKFGTVEGKAYFKYYDEITLTIDGVEYPGIILDTCGACYNDERFDLFVKDKASVTDRGYKGRNMITVEIKKIGGKDVL